MSHLVVFRSITHAQSGQRYLAEHHISSSLMRPPAGLAKGCSYALKVRSGSAADSARILRSSPVPLVGFFEPCGSGWREVRL